MSIPPILAPRASAIIYNLLITRADARPWLLPANICPIVPLTFFKARVPFQFVDIGNDLHLDLEQAADLIQTRGFGGLLYAHTYGEESTPRDFFTRVKHLDPGLLVVDDRCLCIPKTAADDSPADMTLYSTGYAKIAELNFGGYAFIRAGVEYRPVSMPFKPECHDEIEKQYKMALQNRERFVYHDSDWLQIDPPFPAWYDYSQQIEAKKKDALARRAKLNRVYAANLPKEIQLPPAYQTWRFNVRVRDKARILKALFDAGLFASSHYASLAGIMAEGSAPRAAALANEVVNLFNDEHFDEDKARQACAIIQGVYAQSRL